MEGPEAEAPHQIEITGGLDRAAAEALQLEVRRLAERLRIEISEIRIERVPISSSR